MKDERKAWEWYLKAAEQGYANAQCNIGVCYSNGTGVMKEEKIAFEWYSKAAEQGYALAQYLLAYCYQYGMGVRPGYCKYRPLTAFYLTRGTSEW